MELAGERLGCGQLFVGWGNGEIPGEQFDDYFSGFRINESKHVRAAFAKPEMLHAVYAFQQIACHVVVLRRMRFSSKSKKLSSFIPRKSVRT